LKTFKLGGICTVYVITLRSDLAAPRQTIFVDEGFTQSIIPKHVLELSDTPEIATSTIKVINSAMQEDFDVGFFDEVLIASDLSKLFKLKDTGKITRHYDGKPAAVLN
jgi:hypothetical protein